MGREESPGNASNEKKRKAQEKEVRGMDAPAPRSEEPQKQLKHLTGKARRRELERWTRKLK